jgi:uncharacterized protein YndB with AHSA1/START domain
MGGLNWAEHTVEIEAPIETCFEAIVDYESFPEWQRAVVDTDVLDRHKDGLGKKVRLFVDAKVRKVDYTLDYRYQRPILIEWDFVEGNGINDADGSYRFEDLGDGRTRATYRFGLEVGLPLPGPVARRAHRQTLKGSVEDLKKEAERRSQGARPARDEDHEPLASKRFGFGREREVEEPTAARPAEPGPTSAGDESVTGAAAEVVSAGVRLVRVVATRSVGAAGGVMGRLRRFRP